MKGNEWGGGFMYDVIVVGARCAGSPTAMLLARKGYKVLLLDRASFPSEMRMSTHMIHQRGVAHLKRWNLLGELEATDCPPVTHYEIDVGAFALKGSAPAVEGVETAYAPRRFLLDHILVKGAVSAGADLREKCSVEEILIEGGQVRGVKCKSDSGSRFEEKARLVIGADGPASRVARSVDAEEYHRRPIIQGTIWSYWSGVGLRGLEVYLPPYESIYAWPTSGGCVLIGGNWLPDKFEEARQDIEESYMSLLSRVAPNLAERVKEGKREEGWYAGATRNFFRKPYGPGWALVGDAGYKKDPTSAQGITDAFCDAELLAEAVDDAFSGRSDMEEALQLYQKKRDEWALPFYHFTCEMASFEPPVPETIQLYNALRGNDEATRRFLGMVTTAVSPVEFFAPDNVQRIMEEAEGRGR